MLLREPSPVDIGGKWNKAFSSSLWRVEALRAVDRLRLTHEITDTEVADLVRDIQILHETLAIYPVDDRIMQRASETFPTVVGTLAAIHLASKIFIRENQIVDMLLSPDTQLGTAARSLGFRVVGTN